MDEDRDPPAEPESDPPKVPVLQDIVEIRVGPDGQPLIVPLDVDQLAARITAQIVQQLRRNLTVQLESCLEQGLAAALDDVHEEIQRILLAQLADPDA